MLSSLLLLFSLLHSWIVNFLFLLLIFSDKDSPASSRPLNPLFPLNFLEILVGGDKVLIMLIFGCDWILFPGDSLLCEALENIEATLLPNTEVIGPL